MKKQVWYIINFGLVALGLRSGYISLEPERLRHTNPDAIACVAILVGYLRVSPGIAFVVLRICSLDSPAQQHK